MIKKFGMEKSIVVYINADEQYKEWRRVAQHIPLMISLPAQVNNLEDLRSILEKVDAEIIDGSYKDYTKDKVELIHDMGRRVWADVQQENESEQHWDKALATGMDGLQTDNPSDLIEYLKRRGIR